MKNFTYETSTKSDSNRGIRFNIALYVIFCLFVLLNNNKNTDYKVVNSSEVQIQDETKVYEGSSFSNENAKINWPDHVDGATIMNASVVVKDEKDITIATNLESTITKIYDKVYRVTISIEDGSHGTVAIEVKSNDTVLIQSSRSY